MQPGFKDKVYLHCNSSVFRWPLNITHMPFCRIVFAHQKKKPKTNHNMHTAVRQATGNQSNTIKFGGGMRAEFLRPPEGRKILPRSAEMISRGNNLQTNTTYSDAALCNVPPTLPRSLPVATTDIRFLI